VRLRDCVSLFNRFEIPLAQIGQLSIACHEYFIVNALLLPSSVNPAVRTLGHIVPAHCRQVLEKYGQGLGMVNHNNGRERSKAYLSKTDGLKYLDTNM